MLTRRIHAHDANQLELRLAYTLDDAGPKHYTTEVFFFLPRVLGVTGTTYPRARFYEDTQAFVRYQTPRVSLEALADPADPGGWFERVSTPLGPLLAGRRAATEPVLAGLKLLGCVYRGALNREAATLAQRFAGLETLEESVRATRIGAMEGDLTSFATRVGAALERLRSLGSRCALTAVPAGVAETWRCVDELVALVAEEACTSLVAQLDAHGGAERTSRRLLAELAADQYRHRRAHGYPSFVEPDTENETLPYRRAVLRRMVSSALFLDVEHPDGGALVANLAGILAASVAMLFAVVTTIWATRRFDMASAAFVLVAVGSYAVKDRLKEWGKWLFGRRAARYVPDQLVHIRRPADGRLLGACRETVSIAEADSAPVEIRELRHADHPDEVSADGRPETCIRYTKQMRLRREALAGQPAQALNDIVRFNLGHLRGRMDVPYEDRAYVDPESLELLTARCARVHHVNLVIRVTVGRGRKATTEWDRVRLVMDQRGIKRVEPVQLTPGRGEVRTTAPRRASSVP